MFGVVGGGGDILIDMFGVVVFDFFVVLWVV